MKHHKLVACPLLLAALGGLAGCGDRPRPLVSGKLEGVTLWQKPVQRAGEVGSNAGDEVKAGRVDIYENFIVVSPANGPSLVALHGWYTNLRFVKD